jgi:hypothetical protein
MEQNLKEIIIKIENKEKENCIGQMEMFIKEISKLISVKVKGQ